jgi:hypothetical protein
MRPFAWPPEPCAPDNAFGKRGGGAEPEIGKSYGRRKNRAQMIWLSMRLLVPMDAE